MRTRVTTQLRNNGLKAIDADSTVTGGDFLDKIWRIIITVPMGVAIIHEDMPPNTIANVFYELGIMDALGKRTVVVKSQDATVPSNLVRTEYIKDDEQFRENFTLFINSALEQEYYFETMAEYLKNQPLLAIDYLRRAFLISGKRGHRIKAEKLLKAVVDGSAKTMAETLVTAF